MSDTHALLLTRFYTAFAALDAETMADCYAPDSRFEDEVFSLRGRNDIGGMWRMLADAVKAKGRDVWKLEYRDIRCDGDRGQAHWEATYRFSATGRMVHNIIDGEFVFRDGLIAEHRDRFDFPRWSRQALGLPGWLLGGTSLLRNKVRAQAAANLQAFQARATR